jgi:hypothetical protein
MHLTLVLLAINITANYIVINCITYGVRTGFQWYATGTFYRKARSKLSHLDRHVTYLELDSHIDFY